MNPFKNVVETINQIKRSTDQAIGVMFITGCNYANMAYLKHLSEVNS